MPAVKKPAARPNLPRAFLGLADPTRLSLLARIGHDEVCVCDLQSHVGRDQPTVSRHLAMLRKCGLVEHRKEGRWRYYRRTALPSALQRIVDLAAPPRRARNRCCC